ncbi:GYD domain-containing protein [Candidatus Calescamantes bacterium]|nr:GYD domain-containing protein [Candidatus Calescamantes bacterium]
METFLLFGKYSQEALKGISSSRTQQAQTLMEKLGGKIKEIYALLGEFDLLLIVELPGIEEAMKASVSLAQTTGISFTTSPALSVERFDQLMGK